MKKIGFIATVLVVGLGLVIWGRYAPTKSIVETPMAEASSVVVHRSATCGCCKNYVGYLKNMDFTVEDHVTEDIEAIKTDNNIPEDVWSCHTSEFGDYVVEGHIPIEAVEKLFAETPEIQGIALPGMPSGSPGMGGGKQGAFEIFSLNEGSAEHWMDF